MAKLTKPTWNLWESGGKCYWELYPAGADDSFKVDDRIYYFMVMASVVEAADAKNWDKNGVLGSTIPTLIRLPDSVEWLRCSSSGIDYINCAVNVYRNASSGGFEPTNFFHLIQGSLYFPCKRYPGNTMGWELVPPAEESVSVKIKSVADSKSQSKLLNHVNNNITDDALASFISKLNDLSENNLTQTVKVTKRPLPF